MFTGGPALTAVLLLKKKLTVNVSVLNKSWFTL